MKKIFTLVPLFLVVNVFAVNAQQTFSASGGNASGSGGTVSFTVGQTMFSNYGSAAGTLEEGVQHAYEIYPVGTNEGTDPSLVVSVFPNPTEGYLIISIDNLQNDEMSFQLIDINGGTIKKGTINSDQTRIEVANLPPAIYFIQIFQDNQKSKSFKIIKYK